MLACRAVPVLALGAIVAFLAGCGDRDVPVDALRAPGAAPPGIVLVCVDTLRADALSAYGGGGRMPTLDAFARSATVFADASSQSSWTAPSVATCLTGLLPSRHGVAGPFAAPPLSPSVPTLAQRLKEAGWSTAAFTAGAWVSPEQGFARGFEAFGTSFDSTAPEALLSAWNVRRAGAKPFFLFLHTYAAHDPYGPKGAMDASATRPSPEAVEAAEREAERLRAWADAHDGALAPGSERALVERYLTDATSREVFGRVLGVARVRRFWDLCLLWLDGPYALEPDRAALEARLRRAYDEGLAFADGVLARTLAALDALALPPGTVTIVLSDHGEAFGEHATLSHGRRLHDELTRVPLLVRAPGRLAAGTVRGSCGLLDVTPTVLDLAGVAPPTDLDGRSLLPLARGEAAGRPVPAEERRRVEREGRVIVFESTSVRSERAKWIVERDPETGAATESLFDLAADPGEATSLPLADLDRLGPAFAAAVRGRRAAIVR